MNNDTDTNGQNLCRKYECSIKDTHFVKLQLVTDV